MSKSKLTKDVKLLNNPKRRLEPEQKAKPNTTPTTVATTRSNECIVKEPNTKPTVLSKNGVAKSILEPSRLPRHRTGSGSGWKTHIERKTKKLEAKQATNSRYQASHGSETIQIIETELVNK